MELSGSLLVVDISWTHKRAEEPSVTRNSVLSSPTTSADYKRRDVHFGIHDILIILAVNKLETIYYWARLKIIKHIQ